MAGYCTLVLYFHLPAARENTAAHSCNIQPYCLLTHQIIYMYMSVCIYIQQYIVVRMWPLANHVYVHLCGNDQSCMLLCLRWFLTISIVFTVAACVCHMLYSSGSGG